MVLSPEMSRYWFADGSDAGSRRKERITEWIVVRGMLL
jgi:hypothetical protein